jgi:hypothetical protein
MKALWLIAFIGSILGGLTALIWLLQADGPVQQTAAAAVGLAWAVIPYCLARAASEFLRAREAKTRHEIDRK